MAGQQAFRWRHNRIKALGGLDITQAPQAVFFDDFLGDTMATDNYIATLTDATDLTGTNFAINASAGGTDATGHGGWIRGTPAQGTDAATSVELAFGTTEPPLSGFKPIRAGTFRSEMLIFEARVAFPVVLTSRFVVGLNDAATEGTGLAASVSGTTFTTTASDGALWVYDTAATTAAFYGVTVSGDTDSAAGTGTSVIGAAPVAFTSMVLRIELDSSGNAFFYQDGTSKGKATVGGSSLPTVILTPYLGIGNASGATGGISMDCDYILTTCPR